MIRVLSPKKSPVAPGTGTRAKALGSPPPLREGGARAERGRGSRAARSWRHLPRGAVLGILERHAARRQLVPYAIGLGKISGFARFRPRGDQALHLGGGDALRLLLAHAPLLGRAAKQADESQRGSKFIERQSIAALRQRPQPVQLGAGARRVEIVEQRFEYRTSGTFGSRLRHALIPIVEQLCGFLEAPHAPIDRLM